MFALLVTAAGAFLAGSGSAAVIEPTPVVTPPPVATTSAPARDPFALPAVDPARLALARVAANALFRDGTMARMFDQMLSTKPDGYANSMLDLTMGDMMSLMPMPQKMPDAPEMHMTLRQMAAGKDPYFDQRLAAIHDAVVAEAIRLGPKFEPQLREGLANSMARRFGVGQLTEVNRFFATPAGQAFGDQLYSTWIDPALLKSMMKTVPALAAEMPAAMQRIKAASDRYPYPKKAEPAKSDAPKRTSPKATPRRRK